MPAADRNRFLDELIEALRQPQSKYTSRSTRKRSESRERDLESRARDLAQRLLPTLTDAVNRFRENPCESTEWIACKRNEARAELKHAKRIRRLARPLLEELEPLRIDGTIGEVLTVDTSHWSIGDRLIVRDAFLALERIIEITEQVADRERRLATSPPGRRANVDRETLTEWVVLMLAREGVRQIRAKTGIYARVVRVVQAAAGYGDRDVEDMERDLRKALATVAPYLAKIEELK